MNKFLKNDRGFVGVELLLILLVIAIAGGAVWFELRSVHKKAASVKQAEVSKQNTAVNPNKTTDAVPPADPSDSNYVATADDKVALTLPNGWSLAGGGKIINTSKRAACLDAADASPCIYETAFQPDKVNLADGQSWYLSVEKSAWTYGEASDSLLGDISVDNIIDQNIGPLENYDSFYIKVKGEGYTDIHYFISNKGYLLHFWNREQSSGAAIWNNSAYSANLETLVKSLKLNI